MDYGKVSPLLLPVDMSLAYAIIGQTIISQHLFEISANLKNRNHTQSSWCNDAHSKSTGINTFGVLHGPILGPHFAHQKSQLLSLPSTTTLKQMIAGCLITLMMKLLTHK